MEFGFRLRSLASLSCLSLLALASGSGAGAVAAEPVSSPSASSNDQRAQEFVLAALQAEAEGDFLSRQRLLQSAEACAADFPGLKWQQGYLRNGEQWLSIDECIDQLSKDQKLAEYASRRAQLPDTLQDNLSMAQWCASQQLLAQARAHYEQVIQRDSDHVPARLALGYQLVHGEWISPQQLSVWVAKGEAARVSLETYGERLQRMGQDLGNGKSAKSQAAQKAMLSLTDRKAIPAVEAVFGGANQQVSLFVIQWLAQQDNVDGSLALLNYAVQHASPEVRQAATDQLKQRPLHDFVPQLLDMLSTPVFSMSVPYFNRDGSLAGYQQAFAKEESDRTQVYKISTLVARERINVAVNMPGTRFASPRGVRQSFAIAANSLIESNVRELAEMESRTRAALAQQRNQAIVNQNSQVLGLLSDIAEREFSADPREAWQWWDEQNETEYQKSKPMRQRGERESMSVAVYRVSHECFVAGTPVLTTQGLKPIEAIVAGDTLFSRDITSGALVVKPVLQATERPATPTLIIEVDGEGLRCTAGHLFWVSGSGWKKASQLHAGDVLHAAGEPAIVSSVKPAASDVTYNLHIADSNTYFVGPSRVLTHDVTARTAVEQLVPGLSR